MSRRPLRSVRHRTSRPPSYVLCTELYCQLALTLNMCFLRPQDINVNEQHLHKRGRVIYIKIRFYYRLKKKSFVGFHHLPIQKKISSGIRFPKGRCLQICNCTCVYVFSTSYDLSKSTCKEGKSSKIWASLLSPILQNVK